MTENLTTAERVEALVRVLRHYALHPAGPKITEDLLGLAEDGECR